MPLILGAIGAVALLLFLDWTVVGAFVAVIRGWVGWVLPLPGWLAAFGGLAFLVWCLSED
jgi:hypothetical protein